MERLYIYNPANLKKILMVDRRLKLKDVAVKMGISAQTLSLILSGQTNPNMNTVIKLVNATGLTPNEVIQEVPR